jgi:hypothetical protein
LSHVGFYYDRQTALGILKNFSNFCRLTGKTANYTVGATQCDKRWFSNKSSIINIVFMLPESDNSYEIGFVVEESFKITVTPQPTEIIVPKTISVGSSIESSTVGSSIYLKGIGGKWQIISESGTWSAS